jgi:hypothetical protein
MFNFCFAGAYKGGRIEVEQNSQNAMDYSVKVTITIYIKTSSIQADRPTLDSVYFGDGSPAIQFVRDSKIDLPFNISKNIYINTHTYTGPGTYAIHFTQYDLSGCINIPTLNIPLYLETTIVINPFFCGFNSQFVLTEPIFRTPIGKDFHLSRSCYEPRWDSLSYELLTSISLGYWIPPGVSLDSTTGELFFPRNSMIVPGDYAFLIRSSKWNHGAFTGSMLEHIQITLDSISDTLYSFDKTMLPVNLTTHLQPGDLFNQNIVYSDSNSFTTLDVITDIPQPSPIVINNGHLTACNFSWQTTAQDIRTSPFIIVFRGKEDLTYKVFVDGTPSDSCRTLIGINEINKKDFNIFPNPANDFLKITSSDNFDKQLHVFIFDALGKKMIEKNIFENKNLDVSSLSSGLYLLLIEYGIKQFHSKLIIEE